jgi:hypothetical protein
MMTFKEFHNGIRVLFNVDRHEIEDALGEITDREWTRFRDHPHETFVKMPTDRAEILFAYLDTRISGDEDDPRDEALLLVAQFIEKIKREGIDFLEVDEFEAVEAAMKRAGAMS